MDRCARSDQILSRSVLHLLLTDKKRLDKLVGAPRESSRGDVYAHSGQNAFSEGEGTLAAVDVLESRPQIGVAAGSHLESAVFVGPDTPT